MITPPPDSSIGGTSYLIARKTPRAFVCCTSSHCSTVSSRLQGVVVGSVLGDALLGALRRLARENVANRMLDG